MVQPDCVRIQKGVLCCSLLLYSPSLYSSFYLTSKFNFYPINNHRQHYFLSESTGTDLWFIKLYHTAFLPAFVDKICVFVAETAGAKWEERRDNVGVGGKTLGCISREKASTKARGHSRS